MVFPNHLEFETILSLYKVPDTTSIRKFTLFLGFCLKKVLFIVLGKNILRAFFNNAPPKFTVHHFQNHFFT